MIDTLLLWFCSTVIVFLLVVSSKRYGVYTVFISFLLLCTAVKYAVYVTYSGPNYTIVVRDTPICSDPFAPRATKFVLDVDISVYTVVGQIMV